LWNKNPLMIQDFPPAFPQAGKLAMHAHDFPEKT
jgi:hypothetical protein